MSTTVIGPAMLEVKRIEGTVTLGIKMGPIGTDITVADVRVAATALKFMKKWDPFLQGDTIFPREKEATTSYSEISKGMGSSVTWFSSFG
ncbi:hypothetical protein FRC14_004526 [Serendipita sp. 396]|nr:hypothetical protein FRC14_004526 [Serendipita sp. 396]KAG8776629.1 hypothetical protein FRC15_011842 [Serendipita sp. 397]KAG8845325.1 hypothetical protein FRB91_001872 [Serendipita sp. 411]